MLDFWITAIILPIVVTVIVLIVEYWVIQPYHQRRRQHGAAKDESDPSSIKPPTSSKPMSRFSALVQQNLAVFWQNLNLQHKFAIMLFPALIVGMLAYRYLHNNFKCVLMTYLNGESCFQVYADESHVHNHFFPSGFMGDVGDIRCEDTAEDVHSGATAIKVTYNQSEGGLGWAGIVWQFPANNWGTLPGGFDLRGNRYVTFWAKSTRPDQMVHFDVGGLGRKPGTCECNSLAQYPESLCPAVEVTCNLTNQWFRYAIAIPADRDLHHVISGFFWTASNSVAFYLDDVYWVSNPALPPWEGPLVCVPVSYTE